MVRRSRQGPKRWRGSETVLHPVCRGLKRPEKRRGLNPLDKTETREDKRSS